MILAFKDLAIYMRRKILTFGKKNFKTNQCGIYMNVLKKRSSQPGLVHSGKLPKTGNLTLPLKYGQISHPSTPL